MPEPGSRAGVFEAIGGVALLFMVIGIAVAVMQLMSLAEEPAPIPRGIDPPSTLRLSPDTGESDADADDAGGADAPAADDAPEPGKAVEGDDKPPAKAGEEEMEF